MTIKTPVSTGNDTSADLEASSAPRHDIESSGTAENPELLQQVAAARAEHIRQAELMLQAELDADDSRKAQEDTQTFNHSTPIGIPLLEGTDDLSLLPPFYKDLLLDPKILLQPRTDPVVNFYPSFIPLPRWAFWVFACLPLILFVSLIVGVASGENTKDTVDIVVAAIFVTSSGALTVWLLARGQRNYHSRRPLFCDANQDSQKEPKELEWPGHWRAGFYTIGKEALLEYNPFRRKGKVWLFPVNLDEESIRKLHEQGILKDGEQDERCILNIFSRTEGSGGGRSTSYHIWYRYERRDPQKETPAFMKFLDKWCCLWVCYFTGDTAYSLENSRSHVLHVREKGDFYKLEQWHKSIREE